MKSIKQDNNDQKIKQAMDSIKNDNLNKKIEPKAKIEPKPKLTKRKVTDNKNTLTYW